MPISSLFAVSDSAHNYSYLIKAVLKSDQKRQYRCVADLTLHYKEIPRLHIHIYTYSETAVYTYSSKVSTYAITIICISLPRKVNIAKVIRAAHSLTRSLACFVTMLTSDLACCCIYILYLPTVLSVPPWLPTLTKHNLNHGYFTLCNGASLSRSNFNLPCYCFICICAPLPASWVVMD